MSTEPEPFLSPFQKRVAVSAVTAVGLVALGAVCFLAILLLREFVTAFSGVLWPLAVAGILAMLLRPVVELIRGALGISLLNAVLLFYALAIAFLMSGGYLSFRLFGEHLMHAVDSFPHQVKVMLEAVEERFPRLMAMVESWAGQGDSWREWVNSLFGQLNERMEQMAPALRKSGEGLLGFFGFLTRVAIIPVYLFFLLLTHRDYSEDIKKELGTFLKPGIREDIAFLLREFANILVSFFRGQIVIGCIMGVLYATGFSLIGLKFGALIGFALGFLNIIPYLGTILGLLIALPVAYLQPSGGMNLVLLALAVFTLVQVIESYGLTPRIMGQRTGLHPMVIIIAIFFWGTALNGILGMILAIPLTAFFVVAWRLLKRKYLPDIVRGVSPSTADVSDSG